MNVNNMTAQECADWCAADDGAYFSMDRDIGPIGWCDKDGKLIGDHPHPLTLDGAAAALPKCAVGVAVEWHPDWYNGECCAKAYKPSGWLQSFNLWMDVFGPDELTARYRLAVACRMALRGPTAHRAPSAPGPGSSATASA